MIYRKGLFYEKELPISVMVRFYEPKYKKGLEQVHPTEVFFTLDELVSRVSNNHHLLLAIVENDVVGYIYYEQDIENKLGEIVLLHIRSDKRGKGYGSLLLNNAIGNLINCSIEQILVNVRVTNYGAQKLYKKIGFIDKETIYAYKKVLDSLILG
ncbi:GNAT family N-acetyltransferase [Candidatus Clostridium stratigraminis]|uniref:GNAT family N-acetyltransferase n=1 Tax=Candidatus Clostridium stratigraminis TaxID=3381661 RepID=A0ABW8T0J7_9CLOT